MPSFNPNAVLPHRSWPVGISIHSRDAFLNVAFPSLESARQPLFHAVRIMGLSLDSCRVKDLKEAWVFCRKHKIDANGFLFQGGEGQLHTPLLALLARGNQGSINRVIQSIQSPSQEMPWDIFAQRSFLLDEGGGRLSSEIGFTQMAPLLLALACAEEKTSEKITDLAERFFAACAKVKGLDWNGALAGHQESCLSLLARRARLGDVAILWPFLKALGADPMRPCRFQRTPLEILEERVKSNPLVLPMGKMEGGIHYHAGKALLAEWRQLALESALPSPAVSVLSASPRF